jgi:hypothetical protein
VADYKTYRVLAKKKEPLLDYVLNALRTCGCRVIRASEPDVAPFRITFETPDGERLGIIVYAFFSNSKLTRNRPDDEHRFQVKYGSDDKKLHALWQDPWMLYTTLFCGIDPERGIFVAADPVLHSPTRFFISVEYKSDEVEKVLKNGWHVWERDRRAEDDDPVEVLVAGTASSFLRYVRLEREALGEDQGHRMLLAERWPDVTQQAVLPGPGLVHSLPPPGRLHALTREFELSETEVLDLIANARRLKMAVRGWVAEEHLHRLLSNVPGVTQCVRSDEEGMPDISLTFENRHLAVECKNVLRKKSAAGLARVDFQRTRASKNDPCSRYYAASDFDIVAACLHAISEKWEFSFAPTKALDPHRKCAGKLSNLVRVDERWNSEALEVLRVQDHFEAS